MASSCSSSIDNSWALFRWECGPLATGPRDDGTLAAALPPVMGGLSKGLGRLGAFRMLHASCRLQAQLEPAPQQHYHMQLLVYLRARMKLCSQLWAHPGVHWAA